MHLMAPGGQQFIGSFCISAALSSRRLFGIYPGFQIRMDRKTAQSLLRKDIHTLYQNISHSSAYSHTDLLLELCGRCFEQASSLSVRRQFCVCLSLCCAKWNQPLSVDKLTTAALDINSAASAGVFERLGVSSLPFSYPKLRLSLIGGCLEAHLQSLLCGIGFESTRFLEALEPFLLATTPDVLIEVIGLLILFIGNILNHNIAVTDTEANILLSVCRHLYPRVDDRDQRVAALVMRFFGHLFSLWFATENRLPQHLRYWLSSQLIEQFAFGSPFCLNEVILLNKGSLRLIRCLMPHAPLSWIFDRSPYLMTSLFLSLAWNYTATLAGDVISIILSKCNTNVDEWTHRILCPLANFLLHSIISCSTYDQLRYLNETDVQAATKLRLNNFLLHCTKSSLAQLNSGMFYHNEFVTEEIDKSRQNNLFIHVLVDYLVFLLEASSQLTGRRVSKQINEHRINVLVALLPLLPSNGAAQLIKKNMAVIESAVAHQSDAIRARTCSAFSQLIIIDATPSNNLNYISLLLRSLGNLLPSADPTARNTAVHAFFEAAVCLRNRCVNQPTTGTQKEPRLSAAAASSGDGENKYCKFEAANGYPDANLNVIVGIPRYSKTLSPLDVLAEVYKFGAALWSPTRKGATALSHHQLAGLNSRLLRELLQAPLFPPGMSYQRQKTLVMLISSMFELSFIDNAGLSKNNLERCGFERCTTENLQIELNRLMVRFGFPLLDDRSTRLQLIASLPNVNSEIQASILNILRTYWAPQVELANNTSLLLTASAADDKRDLLQLAAVWCNSHLPNVWSAGANLLLWMTTLDHPASSLVIGWHRLDLRDKIQALCDDVPLLCGNLGPETPRKIMLRILEAPGHGYLVAADMILKAFSCRLGDKAKFPRSILASSNMKAGIFESLSDLIDEQLPLACLHLSNASLTLMGCPPLLQTTHGSLASLVSGFGNSSFETLGRAIRAFAILAQNNEDTNNNGSLESQRCEYKNIDDSLTTAIHLLPEYQHVLSWAWNNLKMTSRVLVEWAYIQVCGAFINKTTPLNAATLDLLSHIGEQLIHILMSCRHKGTVETVHQSLQDYLTIAEQLRLGCQLEEGGNDANAHIEALCAALISPGQVVEVCLAAVNDYRFSVNRRAAGLWHASKAALMAEKEASPFSQPLMQKWLSSLLDLCRQDDCGNAGDANSNGPQLDSEKHDFPRGLALHLLRGVFGDAALAAIAFDSPIPEGRIGGTTEYDWITLLACNIALPGFGARQWTVANGSLQLFATIMKRLTGPLHSRPPTSVAEMFGSLPVLFDALCGAILQGGGMIAAQDWDAAAAADPKCVVPLLGLLSRLSPSPTCVFAEEKQERMRECLRPLLVHPVGKIRHLSAEAFVIFVPPVAPGKSGVSEIAALGPLAALLTAAPKEDKQAQQGGYHHRHNQSGAANTCSGQLFGIGAWLRCAPSHGEAVARASQFNWNAGLWTLTRWTLSPRRPCWYLASQLVHVMHSVLVLIPNSKKASCQQAFSEYCRCLKSTRNYPKAFINQPLFSEFHPAFYHLYQAFNAFRPITSKSVSIHFLPLTHTYEETLATHLLGDCCSHTVPSDDRAPALHGQDILSKLLCRSISTPLSATFLSNLLEATNFIDDHDTAATTKMKQIVAKTSLLHRLFEQSELTAAQKCLLMPGVLLAMASHLHEVAGDAERRKLTNWWFENLEPSLSTENAVSQQARTVASLALRRWISCLCRSRSRRTIPLTSTLSQEQQWSLFRVLFCGLFDECPGVRHAMGEAVSTLLTADAATNPSLVFLHQTAVAPLCPSEGARRLILHSSFTGHHNLRWLTTDLCRRDLLPSVVRQAEEVQRLRGRNVLYEPDETNPYFDIQFVLTLIAIVLNNNYEASSSKDVMNAISSEASAALDSVIVRHDEVASLKSCSNEQRILRIAFMISHSPSLYRLAFARDVFHRHPHHLSL